MSLHGFNAIIKIGPDLVGVLKLVGKKVSKKPLFQEIPIGNT
jgi:hypothetical protein